MWNMVCMVFSYFWGPFVPLKIIEDPRDLVYMWVISINIYVLKIKTEKSLLIYLK